MRLRTIWMLVPLAMVGCHGSEDNPVTPVTPVNPVAAAGNREPEIAVTTRKGDKLIVVVDFHQTRALNTELTLAQRREYVMGKAAELYVKEVAKGEKAGKQVSFHAMSFPSRDEYGKRVFRNGVPLAVMDTDHATVCDATLALDKRVGAVEWNTGLK